MKYTVIAYRDLETQKFNPPIFMPFDVSTCQETIVDATKKGQIKGAEYFEAYHLGSYVTETGKFDLNTEPVKLLTLSDYVRDEDRSRKQA